VRKCNQRPRVNFHKFSSRFFLAMSRPIKLQRRTDRTTTLLVAVLLLFLCTEFPQGILGLLSAVRKKCFFKRCYSIFGEVMDLLALINAAIVFVLYGLMSKQFRTTFKTIFCTKQAIESNIALETTRIDTGVTTACV
jgi:thyrotropin-releasing hormone receptor